MRWISTICGLMRPSCGLDHDHLVMWPRCHAYSAEASQLPCHRQSKVLVAGERASERYVDVRASLWPGEPVGKHLGKQPTVFDFADGLAEFWRRACVPLAAARSQELARFCPGFTAMARHTVGMSTTP